MLLHERLGAFKLKHNHCDINHSFLPRGRCKLPDVPLTKVVEPVRYWVKSLPQARISAPPGGKVEKKVHDYFSDEEQELDEPLGAK